MGKFLKKFYSAIIVGFFVAIAALLFEFANNLHLSTPPKSWLFYHQTLVASVIASLGVFGLWFNTRMQIKATTAAKKKDQVEAIKNVTKVIIVDATQVKNACDDIVEALSQTNVGKMYSHPTKLIYENYYKELPKLPHQLGGAFISVMNRFQSLEEMLNPPEIIEKQAYAQQRILFANLALIEANVIGKWLGDLHDGKVIPKSISEAHEAYLNDEDKKNYDESLKYLHTLKN